MSVPELPVHLLLQRSTSFCNSLKNDLEEFIRKVDSDFAAVNREIKIAPKLRRRSTVSDLPGSCILDVKQFTRSKENVLRALETDFADMEEKWSNEASELKHWFVMNVEACLSKIQLQVTVTAEELNLGDAECEVESSSSDSEIAEIPVPLRTPRQLHGLKRPAATAKKRVSFADVPKAKKMRTIPIERVTEAFVTKPDEARTTGVSGVFSSAASGRGIIINKKNEWMSLSRAIEVAPSKPAMYEVKQSRAKNPAYIGHSEDLQKCLLQYWEGKSTRDKKKKQVENFILRNREEISIRYELLSSLQSAKLAQQKKLKEFLEEHKKLPCHNYDM